MRYVHDDIANAFVWWCRKCHVITITRVAVFNVTWKSVCIKLYALKSLRGISLSLAFSYFRQNVHRSCLQILVGLVARRSWKS